jgi:hypothetical protein
MEALALAVLAVPADVSAEPPTANGTAIAADVTCPEAAIACAALPLVAALACPESVAARPACVWLSAAIAGEATIAMVIKDKRNLNVRIIELPC